MKAALLIFLVPSLLLGYPLPSPVPKEDRQPKDCFLVASIAYHRLKEAGIWCEVLGVTGQDGGGVARRHTVLVLQVTSNANVYIYDADGAFDIPTRSRSIPDIRNALNRVLRENDRGEVTKMWVLVP